MKLRTLGEIKTLKKLSKSFTFSLLGNSTKSNRTSNWDKLGPGNNESYLRSQQRDLILYFSLTTFGKCSHYEIAIPEKLLYP